MRIALAHSSAFPEAKRGTERLVADLATHLRAQGHAVDVFYGTQRESLFHLGPQGRTYRMRTPRIRALEGYGIFREELFGARALVPMLLHRYDVVHAFSPSSALAAIATGTPTVYSVEHDRFPRGLGFRRIPHEISKRAIAKAAVLSAATEETADGIEDAFGRRPTVLARGITTERWHPRQDAPSGDPRVIFPGTVDSRADGVMFLFDALTRLAARHAGMRLILPGDRVPGWAMAEMLGAGVLTDAIETLAIETTYDLEDAYRSCDVTVLPVMNDALIVPALESLACGVPVVAGSAGDAPSIIAPGTGFSVPMGDVDALTEAIDGSIELARDETTAARCRAQAICWDWTAVGPSYESAYRSVARARSPR